MVVRALRSSAQLRPEEGGTGKRKGEGRGESSPSRAAAPEGKDTDISLRPAVLRVSRVSRFAFVLPSAFPPAAQQ